MDHMSVLPESAAGRNRTRNTDTIKGRPAVYRRILDWRQIDSPLLRKVPEYPRLFRDPLHQDLQILALVQSLAAGYFGEPAG
jgi:hypothetical protein